MLGNDKTDSVKFLASPWDFHAGEKSVGDHVRTGTPSALQMIEHKSELPMDWIQSVFAAANADRALHKFIKFADMEQDSDQARIFVAVEDWLNDGLDLPGGIARGCLLDWYGENKTASGAWRIGDTAIDLKALDMPALVVASARDRLVPEESSLAMVGILPQGEVLKPDCGHIGMMTGRKAEAAAWQPLARWLVS